jgi:putative glycosyltransferase (TIGR04348 family)
MRPGQPRVVALTGTDVYGDLQEDALARSSIESATRLVVLQPLALGRLSDRMRTKTHVIRQSARPPRAPHRIVAGELFAACVVAHLREVKDPMLAAHAVRCLPSRSRVRVLHLGAALDEQWRMRAEDAVRFTGGRWRWLGDRPRGEALRILAGTELLVLTSVQEGGANVVTEAIACGVPVLSTRIDGSLGILGAEYPGYFDVGDATALAELLARCETDPDFLATLRARCEVLRPLVDPAVERASWRRLLGELGWETRNDQG